MSAITDADKSATETLRLAVDEHASLSTLLAEYETIAGYAQDARWAELIEKTPLPEAAREDVFDSPYYPALEATLRRAESHGYEPDRILADAARALDRHQAREDTAPVDPGLYITRWIDHTTAEPWRGTNRPGPRRVAGLLPRPIGAMSDDMRAALSERQRLIEHAAQQLTVTDMENRAAWLTRLGTPPRDQRAQAEWFHAATTIRLYRERQDITGPAPLGAADQVKGLTHAYEYRAARAAYTRIQYLGHDQHGSSVTRTAPTIDYGRSIGL